MYSSLRSAGLSHAGVPPGVRDGESDQQGPKGVPEAGRAYADLIGQRVGGDGQHEEGHERHHLAAGGVSHDPHGERRQRGHGQPEHRESAARPANASVGSAVQRPTPGTAPMKPATTPAMTSAASQTAHQSSDAIRGFLFCFMSSGMARL